MKKLAFTFILISAGVAEAAQWRSIEDQSKLEFTFVYDGGPIEGAFENFAVAAHFDPADPATFSLESTVDVTSITTFNAERDEVLSERDWFDMERHKTATYQAAALAGGQTRDYKAQGELTLKGITGALPIHFDWRSEGDGIRLTGQARMTGGTMINRMNYDVGVGEWEDDSVIGHQVTISFDVLLERTSP